MSTTLREQTLRVVSDRDAIDTEINWWTRNYYSIRTRTIRTRVIACVVEDFDKTVYGDSVATTAPGTYWRCSDVACEPMGGDFWEHRETWVYEPETWTDWTWHHGTYNPT